MAHSSFLKPEHLAAASLFLHEKFVLSPAMVHVFSCAGNPKACPELQAVGRALPEHHR